MKDGQFQKLLTRAVKNAIRARTIQSELSAAFEARYGKTYSDVDCDYVIDTLDYGTGMSSLTVAQVDREMERCGAPKLKGTPDGR